MHRKQPCGIVSGVTLGLMLSAASWAAPTTKNLFYDVDITPADPSLEVLDGALSVRTGRINFGLLRSGRLTIDAGEGLELTLKRSRDLTLGNGAQVWEGAVDGAPGSAVVLGKQGKSLSGAIRYDGRLFKLVPMDGGLHALAEFPPEEPAPEVPPVPDTGGSGDTSQQGATPDAGNVIDVLAVYTPAAKSAWSGNPGGIESLIATAIAESNVAYQNSQVDLQLNLVHTEEVSYVEAAGSSGWSTDLSRLRGTTDGYMDGVHATRDAVGADMVALIRAGDPNYCGIGYLNNSLGASYAFSVTRYNCAIGYYSFAHELGHNKGSHHDPANASGSALFSYSFGYQDPGEQFRTVMAYNCPGGCTRYQYFSNPNVTFQSTGKVTGVAGVSDNAQSINYAAPIAAGWRAGAATTVPASPGGGGTEAVTESQIGLFWNDNSNDESGFSIEQSTDGASFSQIATTGANATDYMVTDLDADTDYWFRIYAFNNVGPSTGYAAASATTDSPPPYVIRLANGEQTTKASVTGTYVATHADDGNFQTIREASSGGRKRDRYALLEHRWSVDVATGSAATLLLNASSDIGGGEQIVLSWSQNLQDWTTLLTLSGDHSNQDWSLRLVPRPSGTVYFRVRDTQRVAGLQSSNSVSVDYLAVRSDTAAAVELNTAPVLDGDVSDYTTVNLSWTDLEGEAGYEIVRSSGAEGTVDPAAILGPDVTGYQDIGLAENTLYTYTVRGFNGAGNSPDSNAVNVMTETAPAPPTSALSLTLNWFKRRGVKNVELSWDSVGELVFVYRDHNLITPSGVAGTSYSETLGKGGGTYVYKICLADGTTCSNEETAVF
jgi:hypothetical protein